MGNPSSENVRLGFYFTDLIFVVCQSTAKTAKIGTLENFRLYGSIQVHKCMQVHVVLITCRITITY